jgi:hypothetical protein
MGWLITAGTVSVFMGLLLLFPVEVLRRFWGYLNSPIAYIDSALEGMRVPVGVTLLIVGGWIVSVALNYPILWYLHLLGGIIVIFGVFYLFIPRWMERFSSLADQLLFSTDELVLGTRKSFGIILIVVGIYIYYAAYLLSR